MAMPGPNAPGSVTTTVFASGAVTLSGWPLHAQAAGEHAGHLRVVDRLEGEEHVRRGEWRAVRPGHAVAKRQRVGQVVGRRRPFLHERGLERPCGAVYTDELARRQDVEEVDRKILIDDAIERSGLAAERGNQRASACRIFRNHDLAGRIGSFGRARPRSPNHDGDRRQKEERSAMPAIVGSLVVLSANPLAVFFRCKRIANSAICVQILRLLAALIVFA